MASNIVEVDQANWQSEVVDSPIPVLVDFWAPWCSPCIQLLPTMQSVAEQYAGVLKVVKVNCDNNQAIAERFGVRGIPHLVLMRGDAQSAVVQGRSLTRIADELESHLD
jgi:thioredoxin 1